jgi:hypothetical protein
MLIYQRHDKNTAEAELARVQSFAANARLREI